eukprot:COSAG06_NODE_5362_length_3526_cov_40.855601_1_plen_183_part_00
MNALLQDQKHCKKHRKLIRQGLVRRYASTHTYSPTHHASCTLISLTCTAHSYMIATCRIGLLQVLAPHSPCESPYPLGVCARCNLSRALFLPALRREHTARSSRGSSSSVTTRVTTRARLRTTGKTALQVVVSVSLVSVSLCTEFAHHQWWMRQVLNSRVAVHCGRSYRLHWAKRSNGTAAA